MESKSYWPATSGRRVALIVETSLASGREILSGIAAYRREQGHWMIDHEPRALDQAAPAWLRHWTGDGLIVRLQHPALRRAVRTLNIPVVDVLGVFSDPAIPLVHVDNTAVARMAANHLLERGFQSLGYIGLKHINWSAERARAFEQAGRESGYSVSIFDLPPGASPRHEPQAANRLIAWLRALPRPAGVMLCSDQYGPLALEACRRAGRHVPDDIAVIGVDNDEPLCELCDPPLSSVIPDHRRVGYEAAALLDRLMNGKPAPEAPLYLPPRGIALRLSSDALAVKDAAVSAALRFIREHAFAGTTVDQVVKRSGVSRSVLQRRFRRHFGRTIHQELLRVRLEQAGFLLAQSDLSITRIAERTGFRHAEYFSAAFRKRHGVTPGVFRRQNRVA